jgi:putative transposase
LTCPPDPSPPAGDNAASGRIWRTDFIARIRHSAEQIINELREAEVLLDERMKVPEVTRRLGVTAQTYYRWRKEYGGRKTDQAKKLKGLERESARPKKLAADLAPNKAIL